MVTFGIGLQEKTIQRVGQTDATPVDIRVVAATNRDLDAEVKAGRFREDLYFRLDVIKIELPPLRDRADDVLLIARYFVSRFSKEFGRSFDPSTALSDDAIRLLFRFEWPGNIRQLENHIKKAIVLADGPQIQAGDLELELLDGLRVAVLFHVDHAQQIVRVVGRAHQAHRHTARRRVALERLLENASRFVVLAERDGLLGILVVARRSLGYAVARSLEDAADGDRDQHGQDHERACPTT